MARRGGTLTRSCILAQRVDLAALDGSADLSAALWYTPAPGDAAREAAQHAWLDDVLTKITNGDHQ